MTDQTQPEIPGAEKAVTPPEPRGPLGDNNDPGKKTKPAKKTAAKKAPAKKAVTPPEPEKASRDGSYLPALPEGYSYTKVEIDGPNGTRISVGTDVDGKFAVDVETEDFNRSTPYPTFGAAVRGAGERAKLLQKRTVALAAAKAFEAAFGDA